MPSKLNNGQGLHDKEGRGLLCSKFFPVGAVILALASTIMSTAGLEAYYKSKVLSFEKRLLALKVGITERELIDILGRPRSTRRVTKFYTTGENIPLGQTIIEYIYSMKSFEPYVVGGIYVDADKQLLVRLNLSRVISITDGPWLSRQFVIFFMISLVIILMARNCICKRNKERSLVSSDKYNAPD